MKAVRKLVILLTVGVLPAIAALASTPEQTYLETCRKEPGIPVPITVVSPTVGPGFAGSSVQVLFVVGADGKPAEISTESAADEMVTTAVVEAVKQWRFLPAKVDGKPVATKVVLPVRIVESALEGPRVAGL